MLVSERTYSFKIWAKSTPGNVHSVTSTLPDYAYTYDTAAAAPYVSIQTTLCTDIYNKVTAFADGAINMPPSSITMKTDTNTGKFYLEFDSGVAGTVVNYVMTITPNENDLTDLLGFTPGLTYTLGVEPVVLPGRTAVDVRYQSIEALDLGTFLRESYVFLCSDKLGQSRSVVTETTASISSIIAKIPIGAARTGDWAYTAIGTVIDVERLDERLDFYIKRRDGSYLGDARFEVELIFSPDSERLNQ